MIMMNMGAYKHISMDRLPQTNALRVGGHFSVEAAQIGGSICLKICVILDFFN